MNRLIFIVGFLTLLALGYSDPKCQYILWSTSTSSPCAIVNATITLNYHYMNDDNDTVYSTYNVSCPSGNATIANCSSPASMSFKLDNDSVVLTFEFIEEDNKKWNMSEVSVVFENDFFVNPNYDGAVKGTVNDGVSGTVDSDMSYMCNAYKNFSMTTNNTNVNMSLSFADLRVQAFEFSNNNNEFSNARRCSNDVSGSKIVPIAVGAALAGLVIIVLIAYIIGRLRSRRQSSYEALS